jgi:hypothetical protein
MTAGLTTITKFFADRRANAQPATPVAVDPESHGPTTLFVQSFQSGRIEPKSGEDGRYTVTLEHGLGQTIHFSDRPDRIVGTNPTAEFLQGLGFPADNPPNAALLVETGAGQSDIAVVELFNPSYDPEGPTVTYDLAVLKNWTDSVENGFTPATVDLAEIAPEFGTAHLFIDDCPDMDMFCFSDYLPGTDTIPNASHDGFCYSYANWSCYPCQPWIDDPVALARHWDKQCNELFSWCDDKCRVAYPCSRGYGVVCAML